ncbi:MAG: nitrilase-related carbon-nitrogen hydrolase, partial [Burkholderiaceae bacterium]
MLRITVAQLNYMVGDVAGNVGKMVDAARQAAAAHADVVVFSELSLTGYYPGDLLDEPEFLARVAQGLADLQVASQEFPSLHWIVGAPLAHAGVGKRLQNALVVLKAGQVVLRYSKQLLPTYNIFDELRHFAPGPDVARVLRIGVTQVGLMICEDGWNDSGADYAVNPFSRLADAAPDLVVSINASPSDIGKREMRHQVFGAACRRHGFPLLYVNQVGGQDTVVFDGASFAVDASGTVCYEARRFVEDVTTLTFEDGRLSSDIGTPLAPVSPQGLSTMAFYRAQIVLGLRDYARRCGFTKAVIGSSGGIDSALTLALAVDALGA